MFMNEDFSEYGDALIATENGMYGTKGNVIDADEMHPVLMRMLYIHADLFQCLRE